jgi:hypothetical protein
MIEARGKRCYIENEGLTRDVDENKRTKNVVIPVPRDVDEKKRLMISTP